jgi:hypothetical protein
VRTPRSRPNDGRARMRPRHPHGGRPRPPLGARAYGPFGRARPPNAPPPCRARPLLRARPLAVRAPPYRARPLLHARPLAVRTPPCRARPRGRVRPVCAPLFTVRAPRVRLSHPCAPLPCAPPEYKSHKLVVHSTTWASGPLTTERWLTAGCLGGDHSFYIHSHNHVLGHACMHV